MLPHRLANNAPYIYNSFCTHSFIALAQLMRCREGAKHSERVVVFVVRDFKIKNEMPGSTLSIIEINICINLYNALWYTWLFFSLFLSLPPSLPNFVFLSRFLSPCNLSPPLLLTFLLSISRPFSSNLI